MKEVVTHPADYILNKIDTLTRRVEKLEAQNRELNNLIKTYDKLLNPRK